MTIALISILSRRLEAESGAGLLSYFFCQATDTRLNDAISVLRGLIYLLILQQNALSQYLKREYKIMGSRMSEGPNVFFVLRRILLNTLKHSSPGTVYLVVDALDECESRIANLLDFIADKMGEQTNKVRELAQQKGYKIELREKVALYLKDNADETFLWAALVCKTLENQENIEVCKKIISTSTLAYRPLHLKELGSFAGLPKELGVDVQQLKEMVELYDSFLTIRDETIYFVHQSAKDYFTIGNESNFLPKNKIDEHYKIVHRLLDHMLRNLKMDMCDLKPPGALVDHLRQLDSNQRKQTSLIGDGEVYVILKEDLLYWFEVPSLMGQLSAGVLRVMRLQDLIDSRENPNLYGLVHDANQFILRNRPIIEQAPLQTYCSCLIFSPMMSVIRKDFSNLIPDWITGRPIVEKHWSPVLLILEGHEGEVCAISFSLDGKVVASGSWDTTVRLWDAGTGKAIASYESFEGSIRAIQFSPDGKMVASGLSNGIVRLWDTVIRNPIVIAASGSSRGTVRLWDAVAGRAVAKYEGDQKPVKAIQLSPDGKIMESWSENGTV
ncbi:hypothetical protein AOQ84DRAFT_373660 [Glonium stellatum]|uniref:Nephrocystin 3-like N-terminal domain-containing protein n=1 Tax=Glonium stellatum TaxID=574774 RepID=A0A8E2F766_9PEZI|nr:hypothetical protein AOQ84DRAFT_373660 [Glonium stellatum]